MQYAMDYVKRSLDSTTSTLEAPDIEQAGKWLEVLASLYEAWKADGSTAAATAWKTVKKHVPNAELLDPSQTDLIHADELGSLTQPAYILESYPVYTGAFNVVAGQSGSGKSFITLDIAGWISSKKRPVVYVAGEGLHGYASRWYAWKEFHNMHDKAELYFYRKAVQVLDDEQLNHFISVISEKKPALVIIDTLARSAVGMDENSNKEMGMFVHACDKIRNALGVAIVVVHHTGSQGHIRGATALYAAADSVIFVKREDGIIKLINDNERGGKNKYAESMPDVDYLLHPVLAEDTHGNVYKGAVLVKAEINKVSPDEELSKNDKLILSVIRQHGGMKAKEVSEASGLAIATCYRVLGQLVERNFLQKEQSGNYVVAGGDE